MAPLSIDSLRGKQSVRVTFKLAPETIDMLAIMASQLGIKQKTLFDQLIEQQEILESMAQLRAQQERLEQQQKRQKTYVLSQETLETLNWLAKKYKAPRNMLVEMSIRRLQPILAQEKEKHEKRKKLLAKVEKQRASSDQLLQEAQRLLGDDDPACQEIALASKRWQESYARLAELVERGKGIESF